MAGDRFSLSHSKSYLTVPSTPCLQVLRVDLKEQTTVLQHSRYSYLLNWLKCWYSDLKSAPFLAYLYCSVFFVCPSIAVSFTLASLI